MLHIDNAPLGVADLLSNVLADDRTDGSEMAAGGSQRTLNDEGG